MAKRRNQDSDDRFVEDNPIGLTSAFEVIRDPQAVEYDEGDEAIGLTEAFGAVSPDAEMEHSWDKAGKWTDFDWDVTQVEDIDATGAPLAPVEEDVPADADDAAVAEGGTAAEDEPASEGEPAPEGAAPEADAVVEPDSAAAAEDAADAPSDGEGARADADEPRPAADAPAADEPRREPSTDASSTGSLASAQAGAATAAAGTSGGRRGRHAAHVRELSPRMKQSKRTRRNLIVIIVLLIAVLGVLGYFGYRAFNDSQQEAAQQAQEQTSAPKEGMADTTGNETDESTAHLTEVPKLTGLFGKNTDKAIKSVGHGAIVTSNQKVKDKGSAIKSEVSIALTEEPADSKTGTPTVYLGLDKKGKIIQVGYSASASALGFGSFSFVDAVNEKHVIEETFKLMGVELPEGSVNLPSDKNEYTTYGSDKTTVVKERYSFEGDVDVDGTPCAWSAVLSYDYTTQVLTGDLSDTVRIIYAYLTKK